MASIYYRGKPPGGCWWVQFYHPRSGELSRFSLNTGDRYSAELVRRRIELEVELRRPELQLAAIPLAVSECLAIAASGHAATPAGMTAPSIPEIAITATSSQAPAAPSSSKSATVRELLEEYWETIVEENVDAHQANKLSIFRHFFGAQLVFDITGVECRSKPEPYFKGQFIDELTTKEVRQFIQSRGLESKTKRHYREVFHHLFEVALSSGTYSSTNNHTPNPMAALPSYSTRKKPIVFLKPEESVSQLAILEFCPSRHAAVKIMLDTGLRRSEALWLNRDSLHRDSNNELDYLSVLTRYDDESDGDEEDPEMGTLKTEGSTRTVTILPELKEFLEAYLPTLKGEWLVPNPWKEGERWEPENFSSALLKHNKKNGLKWNCLHYRRTYATSRLKEQWNVWDLANEMGTSVAIIQKHYGAFIRPAMLQRKEQADSRSNPGQTPPAS